MNSIKFEKIFLPLYLDYNPETEQVTFIKPDFGTKEYYYNHECFLEINSKKDRIYIDYYSMDDVMLSELLYLDCDYLAFGDLKNESIEQIQSRALRLLSAFIEDAEKEITELFE